MRVIVTGGGTGGHIYPALAIIDELRRREKSVEILYVGTKTGLEHEVVVKAGIPFEMVDVKGFSSKSFFKKVGTVKKASFAVVDSIRIMKTFKPDLVVGTGGYVTGPVVLAASLMGIKTAIHEQNVFPGKTNRLLSKVVKRIYLSYEESGKYFSDHSKLVLSGNPIRNEFESLNKEECRDYLGIPKDTFFVVSFGGSGGAKKINDTMMLVLNFFKQKAGIRLLHITGKSYYEKFMKNVNQSGLCLGSNICVKDYLFDIPKYICAADLVIGRAGATSLAELLAVRTPSILIPSPNVADDHQTYNAKEMERLHVSVMMKEESLTDAKISQFITECLENEHKLDRMKLAFDKITYENAAKIIVKDLMKLLK